MRKHSFIITATALLAGLHLITAQITTSEIKTENTGGVTTIAGNVGIGITNLPDNYKFVIKQSSSNSQHGLRILNAAESRSAQLWVGTGGAVLDAEGSTSLHLRTGGTDRLYIHNNGNIGVGTTNLPDNYKFVIKQSGSSSQYGLRILNAAESRSAQFWVGTGGAVLDAEGSASFHLRTGGTDRLYIHNNGRIGIGTTNLSDNYKFVIKQSGSASQYGLRILNAAENKSAQLWVGTGGAVLDAEGSTSLHLRTGGADRLYIHNNGNIGIGTTNLSGNYKLNVNGSLNAHSLYNSGVLRWSDFVFKEDYPLPSLAEVEQHIKEFGRLQHIPSEKEVVENGYNMGNMDAKLLQKIEELTLYTIEQQKLIGKLAAQNENLIKRIETLENKKNNY